MPTRTPSSPPASLETLKNADRNQLASLFEAEFGLAPAPRASLDMMLQNLAWAQQARSAGHDPRKRRQALIKALDRQIHGKSTRHSLPYRPGTRLIREWRGTVYEVTVLEKGFAWEGRTYPNLSRIATEITGTKWSGPRFFGLNGGKNG
jgi:transposase